MPFKLRKSFFCSSNFNWLCQGQIPSAISAVDMPGSDARLEEPQLGANQVKKEFFNVLPNFYLFFCQILRLPLRKCFYKQEKQESALTGQVSEMHV